MSKAVLVLVCQSSCYVESGQKSKDVGLKALHHKLKKRESDSDCKGEWANQFQSNYALQQVLATQNEDKKQQVASEHICK